MSKLTRSEISALLQRIEFYEAISVSSQVLKKLHLAFVTHIPFETLDIFWKRRFSLSLLDLYKKVVIQQRGGYCYELNGLFYYLLQGLSFDVSICNAQLYDSRGLIIPRSQHMVLVVELENPWLVDVGYGNGFLEPLLIESSQTQKQGDRFYQCIRQGSRYVIEEMSSGIWQPWYAFTKESKQMSDFEDRNYFHQTSRESIFFEKRISMIMQEDETVELKGNQLTRKTSAGTFITMIEEEKILELLQREFGIKISTV